MPHSFKYPALPLDMIGWITSKRRRIYENGDRAAVTCAQVNALEAINAIDAVTFNAGK